jgi:hypothetical protein
MASWEDAPDFFTSGDWARVGTAAPASRAAVASIRRIQRVFFGNGETAFIKRARFIGEARLIERIAQNDSREVPGMGDPRMEKTE